jgi:predicted aspartyl protease
MVPENGRVTTAAKIENLQDLWLAETGAESLDSVRSVDIDDALVDTGSMILSLPTRVIQQLGLRVTGQKRAMTTGGPRIANVYQAVRLTVQDRDCTVDVLSWRLPIQFPC